MRKNYKRKRLSCAMCKPNKTGGGSRWTDRERDAQRAWEQEALEWEHGAREFEVWPSVDLHKYDDVLAPPDTSGVWSYGQEPPASALGVRLREIRQRIVESGAPLSWDELDQEDAACIHDRPSASQKR